MKLSLRAQNLKTSPTLFLVAKAKELAAKGHDVISLTVGEPDWETFPVIQQAGQQAILDGQTKYTPAQGTVELRKAIAARISTELGQSYGPNDVVVGPGAKFVIFSALQMLCDPGDEVIISAPFWVSYPTMIELAGGVPKIVECGQDVNFKLTADKLAQAITSQTKAFLYCSPSNPTGLAYSVEELKAIAEVLRKNPQVMVISDDMYNRLNFETCAVAPHLLHVAPDLKDRVVAINGGSKAYSMTGWRIGWGVGPTALIKAMGDYQSQATGCPSSIAQSALLKGLSACDEDISKVNQLLLKRRDHAVNELKKIPEFTVTIPDGAFYLWVHLGSLIGKTYNRKSGGSSMHNGKTIQSSREFCDILLEDYYVATVPGIECGLEGYLRLSFATSEQLVTKAILRLLELRQSLSDDPKTRT